MPIRGTDLRKAMAAQGFIPAQSARPPQKDQPENAISLAWHSVRETVTSPDTAAPGKQLFCGLACHRSIPAAALSGIGTGTSISGFPMISSISRRM